MNYDVLVIGGGNAALCAAISANEQGANVLLLERAPRELRGGNSCHTRNLRCMHNAPTDVLLEVYSEEEYFADLIRVTGGQTDEKLARMAIQTSANCTDWMASHGVRFQPSLGGTMQLGRTNAFFLGGGKALVNAYYKAAQRLGIKILYNTRVIDIDIRDGIFKQAIVDLHDTRTTLTAKALVVAAGGFESNLPWLIDAWGPAAENFIIRGTKYNEGDVLRTLLDRGMQAIGDPTQCHAVAIDARAPRYDGGIVTRLDCVSLGIVVNQLGQRFYDEGEDFWPKRYAIWGRLVAQQPSQIAYCIIDNKVLGRFMPSVFPPIKANSIEELATALRLPIEQVCETVTKFNIAVQPGEFNNSILDNCSTQGLTPNKTHWAQKIDSPPYYGYPLRPGITFTYLGVKVDEKANVYQANGQPSANIYAAGEIMAGNILGKGYIAGIGMTIGTVFGRIAGKEAANYATH